MPRIGVVSDIHGNAIAFMAVLNELGRRGVDELYCLGDIVGYGPSPARCLDLALTYCDVLVRGNHDEAVFIESVQAKFNPIAWAAIEWTRKQLSDRDLDFLLHMKTTEITSSDITCTHDTPVPDETAYVLDLLTASEALAALSTGIGLVGHTHVPRIFTAPMDIIGHGFCPPEAVEAIAPQDGEPVHLPTDHVALCNPGAVGQPRDSDPRASCAILDTEQRTFTVHRVDYDIRQTRADTIEAGLPAILGERLSQGI
ncbi:MAG: hypothetical protein CMJ24_07500 [Phycisphaerae bacterium]|nr:hypothetical protein [Phycisphaerae bacterium]|tara:strand:- start:2437 stop:3204 length:768 start_codon:yes stop_codon:yes gene_type:complete